MMDAMTRTGQKSMDQDDYRGQSEMYIFDISLHFDFCLILFNGIASASSTGTRRHARDNGQDGRIEDNVLDDGCNGEDRTEEHGLR